MTNPSIGILAVQGDFSLHRNALDKLSVNVVEVRKPAQLDNLDGLIIPGGESTTFQIVMSNDNMWEALRDTLSNGLSVWGTCAGSILLGYGEGRPQPRLNLINAEVKRNAFGRQVDSFVAPLKINTFDDDFMGVFIRAPRFIGVGNEVSVLAEYHSEPVMARQGNVLITSFHPELTDDLRVHQFFISDFCNGKK